MARCMNDSAMNLPEPHSSAATPRVPDYKPRNRLDPKWRPGTSVRSKMALRASAEVVDDPWMYSQRSLREHRRLMPAQRIVLWLLLATGITAAGLVGLGMSGADEGQQWSASAAHAGRQEGAGPPALRAPSRPAAILADAPQASPPVRDTATRPVATASVHEDTGSGRAGPATAGGLTPAGPVTHAGMRLAPALSVTPVLAEQAPAAMAPQVQANLLPSAAPSGDDDARRARGPQAEAKNVECRQAQQAMQLCGIADPASR